MPPRNVELVPIKPHISQMNSNTLTNKSKTLKKNVGQRKLLPNINRLEQRREEERREKERREEERLEEERREEERREEERREEEQLQKELELYGDPNTNIPKKNTKINKNLNKILNMKLKKNINNMMNNTRKNNTRKNNTRKNTRPFLTRVKSVLTRPFRQKESILTQSSNNGQNNYLTHIMSRN